MALSSEIEKQIEEFNEILLYYIRNQNRDTEESKENLTQATKSMITENMNQITTKTIETQTSDLPGCDGRLNDGTTLQYHNFIRLNLLFPDLHPATIHGALGLCKNDFILTVDSLIYARNFRKSNVNVNQESNELKSFQAI